MQSPTPLTRDLVLIGGGHTHALVLRMWGMKPLPGARLTLISPDPVTAYSGMLPGFVAGHYPREALDIDLVRLARHAGARLILGRVEGIDRPSRKVRVAGRPPIGYDVLSIDIGISSDMPALPGFSDHAVAAKPLDVFASRWGAFVAGGAGRRVAVIGGGVAGVELALAATERLGPGAEVTIIEANKALSAVSRASARALLAELRARNVALIEGVPAVAVRADAVELSDGRLVASDFTIGAAGTRPQGWLLGTGLQLTDGYVAVGPTLGSVNDPSVFAAGDIAHMTDTPRPKAGVFAVRQAPVLLCNLTAALTGNGRLRTYRPQSDYLKLVSVGGKSAVADKWGMALGGRWVWSWKDRIDRRFMQRFDDLPRMPEAALPSRQAAGADELAISAKPLCGGCGAKVGQADLRAALAILPPPHRPDVLSGPGDDAALLTVGGTGQLITTDHLRAFTEDPWLMARIAAIHALGDVWAMGARPQAALVQVILPRMAPRMQADTLAEILHAAAEVFTAEGADIVGGHSSVGAELTIGFTVTGLPDGPAVTQAGARPGDRLILTKPIGTGVILAAEMQRDAPGPAVVAALRSMAAPQGRAAAILGRHATAMTDVTGFGLAGHLLGILDASRVAARICMSDVPILAGAEALSARGHGSSLLPANRAASARVSMQDTPLTALLFDPQTAGGLLATVPGAQADQVLADLSAAGTTQAAIIGTITEGAPLVTVE